MLVPNGWRQHHAQLGFEHWVLDGPPCPKTVEFYDLLGTPYSMFPIKRTVFFSSVTVVKNTVRLIGNIELLLIINN